MARHTLRLLVFAVVAAVDTSRAQDAPTPPRQIEEIVVTAQKKEQNVQDVPISMTALSGDFLAEAGASNIHDIAKFAPNVNFQTNAATPTIFIRGFGTPFNGSSFDPAVGLALDELSISQSIYFAEPLYDVARVEVLRGPQGTLFGKNTTGGLFNITTTAPSREFTGVLIARVGGLGVHRVEAAAGGSVGPLDWAQFRLALLDSEEAGDVENTKLRIDEPKTKQHAARLKVALQPLDGLNVTLIGSLARTEGRAFQFQQHHLRDSSVRFLRQFDPRFEDDGLNHQDSVDYPAHNKRRTNLIQGNFRYDLGDLGMFKEAEIVAVLGYTQFGGGAPLDFDFSPADIAHFLPPSTIAYDQRSAELRAGANVPAPFGLGDLEILTGGLYYHSTFLTDVPVVAGKDFGAYLLSAPGFETVTGSPAPNGVGFENIDAAADALGLPPPPAPAPFVGDGFRVRSDQATTSLGVFGQVAWHPTERWTATAGGRFTYEKKTALLTNRCFQPGFLCAAFGAHDYTFDHGRTEHNFSPRFTAQYHPFGALTLFASRTQGFKSGGFNNFSITGQGIEVDAEEVASWETGAKGTLFDDTLAYSGAFFNTDADNLQVQNFVGTAIEVRNAASARSRGVEFDARWLTPLEALSIFAAGAFTDARFKDYPNAPAPRGSSTKTQDLSSKRLPFVSKWQFNVTPTIRLPFETGFFPQVGSLLPPRLAFTTALDLFYRSDQFLDLDLDPNARQGAYVLLNGRIGLSNVEETLSLNLSANNLTNARAFEFVTDSTFFPHGYMGVQEFRRNVAVEMRYRW